MHVWNLLHAARWKCRTQKSRKKSPSGHHHTTLSGYIFATKACIDNRKKNLLSINTSSTCPHNMVDFGPLAAEILSLVWGTPGNFNGFRDLAALLHCTLVVGVSQTAALNRGRHLHSAGRPSRWALAHISSYHCTANLQLNLKVREFKKPVKISQSYRHEFDVFLVFRTQCRLNIASPSYGWQITSERSVAMVAWPISNFGRNHIVGTDEARHFKFNVQIDVAR